MSFEIVSEVLAHMPRDSTAAERLVLVVLAHHADKDSRECWPSMELLEAETGLNPATIGRAITRIEQRLKVSGHPTPKVRLRAPAGGRLGTRGRSTVYRIPRLASTESTSDSRDASTESATDSGQTVALSLADGRTFSARRSQEMYDLNQRTEQPSSEPEVMTINAKRPDPMDELLAKFSESHPGREREALHAALALYERREGHACRSPAPYFAPWTVDDLRSQIKLPAQDPHVQPWCGRCDGPTTRRLEDSVGNVRYDARGSVVRCTCWSPRSQQVAV